MNKYLDRREDILTVLTIQERTDRIFRFICTLAIAGFSLAALVLVLLGLNRDLFTITNDFASEWNVSGWMFVNGYSLDGVRMTGMNILAIAAYVFAAAAIILILVYFVLNIIHAAKCPEDEPLSLTSRKASIMRIVIGCITLAGSLIFMLFELVYAMGMTPDGIQRMADLSVEFSFNKLPTSYFTASVVLMFLAGCYFLCSGISRTAFWKEHQGGVYIAGLVVLILFFWQYGYLHRLFGIDPNTVSFPYPFPRAINSYSMFTGSVKGEYNSVFGSIVHLLVRSDNATFNNSILYNALTTVAGMFIGYVLGALIGYMISVVAACFKNWGAGILTICSILAAFPVVALGPIVNHWFPSNSVAFSLVAKIIVVTILSMAGMVVNAYKGLTVFKPFSMDLMNILNADTKTSFIKLRLPNSLPNVFNALKINAATALMGSFVCEFYSRSRTVGLGMMFNNYWDLARYMSWAYIIAAVVFGLILYLIAAAVERKCIGWHPSMRKK